MVFADDGHGAGVIGPVAAAPFAVVVGGRGVQAGPAVVRIAAGFRFFFGFCFRPFLRRLFAPFTDPSFVFAPDPARMTPRGFPAGVSPRMENGSLSMCPLPLGFP